MTFDCSILLLQKYELFDDFETLFDRSDNCKNGPYENIRQTIHSWFQIDKTSITFLVVETMVSLVLVKTRHRVYRVETVDWHHLSQPRLLLWGVETIRLEIDPVPNGRSFNCPSRTLIPLLFPDSIWEVDKNRLTLWRIVPLCHSRVGFHFRFPLTSGPTLKLTKGLDMCPVVVSHPEDTQVTYWWMDTYTSTLRIFLSFLSLCILYIFDLWFNRQDLDRYR